MKAAEPAAEVVDRTDQLDTADAAMKTEDAAVQAADDTAVAVDDVDDTAATAAGMGDHISEEHSKLHSGVMRSVLLRKKGLHFILQPSRLNDMLLQDAIR